jgi:hypothetical protein
LERGDQMRPVCFEAISPMSAACRPMPCTMLVFAVRMSLPPMPPDRQRNSLKADFSMPSAMCGR